MLLCFQTSVCAICPNHEVVVFQPWTGTDPYLGSIANYTFYYNPPAPPVSTNFCIFSFPPYVLSSSYQLCSSSQPLSQALTPHRISYKKERSTWTSTATCQPPASATCLCAQRHVSIFAAFSDECATPPPLPPSACYYHYYSQCCEIYSVHIVHWYLSN